METALKDTNQESDNDSNFYDNDYDEYLVYSTSSNNKNIKAIKQHSKGIFQWTRTVVSTSNSKYTTKGRLNWLW